VPTTTPGSHRGYNISSSSDNEVVLFAINPSACCSDGSAASSAGHWRPEPIVAFLLVRRPSLAQEVLDATGTACVLCLHLSDTMTTHSSHNSTNTVRIQFQEGHEVCFRFVCPFNENMHFQSFQTASAAPSSSSGLGLLLFINRTYFETI
jgi:hypothetical protein